MSANKKPTGPFEFGIMDLSRFLNKGPASLRKWESDGHFVFPRNDIGVRVFTSKDIREIATKANVMGRITVKRKNIVEALMTVIEWMEEENA